MSFYSDIFKLASDLWNEQARSSVTPLCQNSGNTLAQSEVTHSLTPRRYNLCRVLADSRSRLRSSLPLTLALQFLTPNFSASFVTPSIHLRFGLPVRLLPSGLSKVIFLYGRLSCIRITCPANHGLVILIVVT